MIKEQILPGGDRLRFDNQAMVIEFAGPRRVLGTSYLNGGLREDLRCLFNFSEVYGVPDERCEMRAPTNEGHLRVLAEELGLTPALATGLSTAAKMRYLQVREAGFGDFKLATAVTAGIDVSGNRVGDKTDWHEEKGVPLPVKAGTINIFLHTDALLTPGAMARALTVCSEAKTAALQEILAASCFSNGLASGSGTDGVVISSCLDSQVELTNAGTHVKLGEYIGRLVKETVIEALVAENGFHSFARGSLLKRVSRFGINEKSLWLAFKKLHGEEADPGRFKRSLQQFNSDEKLILEATLIGHLIDLLQWRMADGREVAAGARERLLQFGIRDAELEQLTTGGGLTTAGLVNAIVKALEMALLVAIGRLK